MSAITSKMGYRPCVGIMLLNRDGFVWIGRRFEKDNDEGGGYWWQMPQGGIDGGEEPHAAAVRELEEETAVTSAVFAAEAAGWFNYDVPRHLIGKAWGGRFRGQTQKWFAFSFTGGDSEINIAPPGRTQEFDQWRWAKAAEVLDLIVPFKRPVYVDVLNAFKHLTA
jgi:putative (di)nucleoside polyphosphate hydrolase